MYTFDVKTSSVMPLWQVLIAQGLGPPPPLVVEPAPASDGPSTNTRASDEQESHEERSDGLRTVSWFRTRVFIGFAKKVQSNNVPADGSGAEFEDFQKQVAKCKFESGDTFATTLEKAQALLAWLGKEGLHEATWEHMVRTAYAK